MGGMMKLTRYNLAFLGISAIFDIIQGAILFEIALCAVPSITAVGFLVSILCWLAVIGQIPLMLLVSVLFSSVWMWLGKKLLKKNVDGLVAVAEIVPFLDALPLYTGAAVYYLIEKKR
jgi:hypothetical protein